MVSLPEIVENRGRRSSKSIPDIGTVLNDRNIRNSANFTDDPTEQDKDLTPTQNDADSSGLDANYQSNISPQKQMPTVVPHMHRFNEMDDNKNLPAIMSVASREEQEEYNTGAPL